MLIKTDLIYALDLIPSAQPRIFLSKSGFKCILRIIFVVISVHRVMTIAQPVKTKDRNKEPFFLTLDLDPEIEEKIF